MRVMVTGAAGFIGYHLCQRLMNEGHQVFGLDNLNSYYEVSLKKARLAQLYESPAFRFAPIDLADARRLHESFEEFRPDIVVNLAAQAGVRYSLENPNAYIQSNVVGFANMLEACRNHRPKHVLYASSSSVYGANTKTPFSVEDRTDTPVSLYAATKKSNELLAYTYSHLYGIRLTGLRFFTVYGPWGRPDMAYFSFTRDILSGTPIRVFNEGKMRRDFTYIDDIIAGIMALLDSSPVPSIPPHRVYNLGNNRPVELITFIQTLEEKLGRKANMIMDAMQPGDVVETYADIDESSREFGFRPQTTLSEGLERFVDWYRDYYQVRN